MTQSTIDSEAFVMWAAKMATDFADGKTWRTGQFRAKLDHLIAQEAKAFGGCRNCYGKGYATVISGTKGYADFGGDGFQTPPTTHIKYCSCDRGKQLKQVVAQEANKARLDELRIMWDWPKDKGLAYFEQRIQKREAELIRLTADKEQA